MISPAEIRIQALKWWTPFLQSKIRGEVFFPKVIDRIGKVQAADITGRFEKLQREIELLNRHSKHRTGSGYVIRTAERSFRRTGNHELPDAIVFETSDDYISFTGKKEEWNLFLSNLEKINASLPQLHTWMVKNCTCLADSRVDWTDILKVCHYFINTPDPNLYLRQLPIEVHTKFIENNSSLIQSLLDFLIPNHIRDVKQKRFAERYFIRYDEPLIRIRFLDAGLTDDFSDISIPLSDFEKLDIGARNILITENKMNFLTLPPLAATIAVWSGGGFNISFLKNACYMGGKNIFYWGDIDEHGFQILHQLRSYYPQTTSIMMDLLTFKTFEQFAVTGSRSKSGHLSFLTTEEYKLFELLKSSDPNRLEQEKISQVYAEEYLSRVVKNETHHR